MLSDTGTLLDQPQSDAIRQYAGANSNACGHDFRVHFQDGGSGNAGAGPMVQPKAMKFRGRTGVFPAPCGNNDLRGIPDVAPPTGKQQPAAELPAEVAVTRRLGPVAAEFLDKPGIARPCEFKRRGVLDHAQFQFDAQTECQCVEISAVRNDESAIGIRRLRHRIT